LREAFFSVIARPKAVAIPWLKIPLKRGKIYIENGGGKYH